MPPAHPVLAALARVGVTTLDDLARVDDHTLIATLDGAPPQPQPLAETAADRALVTAAALRCRTAHRRSSIATAAAGHPAARPSRTVTR